MSFVIRKVKLINFKKFANLSIDLNDGLTIIVGNNDTGKSSLLAAINMVLSGSYTQLERIGLYNLLNRDSVNRFLNGHRNYDGLPKLVVEVYFKDTGIPYLNGNNNSDEEICDGVRMEICPNDDYGKEIKEIISKKEDPFPYEYYKCEFKTFSGLPYNSYNKYARSLSVNISGLDSNLNRYIRDLYINSNTVQQRNSNLHKYTKAMQSLSMTQNTDDCVIFRPNYQTENAFINNLTIYNDNTPINLVGDGEKSRIKIEQSISSNNNVDHILIDEPEIHQSSVNTRGLVGEIVRKNKTQIIIATHNSAICSRLGLCDVVSIGDNDQVCSLQNLDGETSDFFKKCPSDNLLVLTLSKKVILVEGAAEYILIKKIYSLINESDMNSDGVEVISVGGVSFKRYANVADILGTKVAIITDNDGDYEHNVIKKYKQYDVNDNIFISSEKDNNLSTFEKCIYSANKEFLDKSGITTSDDVLGFMLNNKADCALKILELLESDGSDTKFTVPEYIAEAVRWIKS